MSAQRRTVASDTASSRAAWGVERPRREPWRESAGIASITTVCCRFVTMCALLHGVGVRSGQSCEDSPMGRLDELDLSLKLKKKEEAKRLAAGQERLLQLRLHLGGLIGEKKLGPPVCILMEGWDAGGKGGAIKRLVAELDARHVRVAQFAAPTFDEKRH